MYSLDQLEIVLSPGDCRMWSGPGALEAPRLEIDTFIKRSNKEMIRFRGASQIEKSSCGALEAARLEIDIFHKER